MNAVARIVVLAVLLVPALAGAVNPAVWTLDETLTRSESELFWTSPTAVDLGLDRYTFSYEITRVTANGLADVTSQIGEAIPLTGMGEADALPILLFASPLNDPITGTTANIRIEVDNDGFGQAAFTDVMLGSVSVFGFPVAINSINVQATVTVAGEEFAPGDYNGDGVVDNADFVVWTNAFGSAAPNPADGNDDGVVNVADYAIWREALSAPAPVSVPEPATLGMAIVLAFPWGGWGQSRRRRPQL